MTTELFVLVVIAVMLGWEVFSLRKTDDRIKPITTVVVRGWRRYSILIFLAGVLCGHWFWPYCDEEQSQAEVSVAPLPRNERYVRVSKPDFGILEVQTCVDPACSYSPWVLMIDEPDLPVLWKIGMDNPIKSLRSPSPSVEPSK